MKAYILFLLINCLLSYPQGKVEKIMDISETENIHDISKDYVIFSEDNGIERDYYLLSLLNPSLKEFMLSTKNYQNDYVKFSPNGRYICLNNYADGKSEISFYNIETKSIFKINKPGANVVSASIINEEKILYQVRVERIGLPQIYLFNKITNDEKFITVGIGEEWSPDGKYFIVKKINEEPLKKIKEKNYREKSNNKKGYISVYDLNGREILSFSD